MSRSFQGQQDKQSMHQPYGNISFEFADPLVRQAEDKYGKSDPQPGRQDSSHLC